MRNPNQKYRIEQDSTGTMEVPIESYYGVQSLRAMQNFPISGSGLLEEFITSVVKITVLKLVHRFVDILEHLHKALYQKSVEFDDVLKMARTQLQDAVPMRLGQSFSI